MVLNFTKIDNKLRKNTEIFKFLKLDLSFFVIFIVAFFLDEVVLYFYFVIFTLLHEFSHFFTAKKLGYYPQKICLSFYGAVLEGDDDFMPSDEIKVVLAGPLFNLFVIILCYLSFWFFPETYNYLYDVLIANWSILIFNLLPIYPLDLGRIILVLFSRKYVRKEALRKTKFVSIVFISFMFLLFLLSFFYEYNFTLGFVCLNLVNLFLTSSKDTSFKRQLFAHRKYRLMKKGLIERNVYVEENMPLFKLFKFIDDYHYVNFVFVSSDYKEKLKLSEVEFYRRVGLL